jgi:hypothetical protein
MRRALRGLASAALPSLRVVALVYAGLSGIAVLVVVITAAVSPRTPVVQQVTEPAREAVTTLVQPTTDMVTGIIAPPPVVVVAPAAPTPVPFVDFTSLDVVIDTPPTAEPVVVERPQPRVVYVPVPAPSLDVADDQAVIDDGSAGTVLFEDAPPADDLVVSAPQDAPALQEASAEAPRPLPTPTVVIPTTAQQVKAQVDAANQAAIDAAKTATATAKAQADAANQAAIDAAKAAAKAKH